MEEERTVRDAKCSLLIVDDEPYILTTLARLLQQDFTIHTAQSGDEGRGVFAQHRVDVLLCDQRMPGLTGVQLLEWVRQNHPKTIRLLMSGFADMDDVVEAINRGHVYRYLFKPWRQEELVQTLRDAAKAFHLQESHEQLLVQLREHSEELQQRVRDRTAELEEANRQLQQKNSMLERLALTDQLTGLPNRRAIEQILLSEIRRRMRYPSPLAVGMVDADHFKEINTRYLYPGGDQVLIHLGGVLGSSLRGVDSVGRMGGEEFLIVAPETTFEGAQVLSERIRHAVEQSAVEYQGQQISVTVSIGFVVAGAQDGVTFDQMIHQSAAALAEAKGRGRNRCVVQPVDLSASAEPAGEER